MKELIGQRIDNFQIETLLGEGGMGAVFKATDVNLKRTVALKVMKPAYARDATFQQRFLQEAQSAARLKHDAIVQIFHFGNRQGKLYMAMTYIPGPTLGAYVRALHRKKQVILLSESLLLVAQIADALGYAHRQGVVHRDVKPDNVLLEKLDDSTHEELPIRAVVTDFGLAKLTESGVQTKTGAFMGTMPYMSPEQCRGRNIDGRSDIYSLGIMLYQLVTGRLPFADIKTPVDAAEKHIREIPPNPRELRPSLPESVESIVLRAIAKQANDRFQSGEEMAMALREAANVVPSNFETKIIAPSIPAVSLVTELLPDPTFISEMEVDSGLARPVAIDYLIIKSQEEAGRTVPLEKDILTIGRSKTNDIVLPGEGISRDHARIERTPSGWQLVDLNSSNGTWVLRSRLLADVPQEWKPGQVARIGSCYLQWQPAEGEQEDLTYQPGGVPSGATQILSMDGDLGVVVNPTNIEVEPGDTAEVQIELFHQGIQVDHFELRLEGISPEWVIFTSEPVRLLPHGQASLPLTISPPRDSQSQSGRYRYRLVIYSQTQQQDVATITGQLTVGTFAQFSTDAQPTQFVNGGTSRISIHNKGNSPATFTITGQDSANAILFLTTQGTVTINAGQSTDVLLKIHPRIRPFTGRVKSHSFQIEIAPKAGRKESKQGILEVHPRIPNWVLAMLPLLAILCCIVAGFAATYWNNNNLNTQSKAEAATATAVYVQQVALSQMTADASATFAASDDDGDGLNNDDEAQMGTDPNNPDSDADGLLDGEERVWGTNPIVVDTDGDTLPDGREVNELKTSPINIDTDGDGQPDNVDPDPGKVPTPTPLPTEAPEPTVPLPPSTEPTFAPTPTPSTTPTVPPTGTPTLIPTDTPTLMPADTPTLMPASQDWNHTVNLLNNRTVYYLRLKEPGQITVNANWTGQQTLAIIINGPGRQGYFAREDGSSPLSASYNVNASDFASGDTWRVTIANFGDNRAEGTITISYPGGSSSGNFTDSFVAQPSSGSVVHVLVLEANGRIDTEAIWNGNPASLALIINGPGQVGYYAREDGSSPLSVNYNVTLTDFGFGDYWRVSFITFSQTNGVDASISLIYP